MVRVRQEIYDSNRLEPNRRRERKCAAIRRPSDKSIVFDSAGINQLQWALEFLKCMKVDYNYPASIEKIVNELEERLIQLYAKVGGIIQEDIRKKEMEQNEMEKEKSAKCKRSSKRTPREVCDFAVSRRWF